MIALVAALMLSQVDAGTVDAGVSVEQLYTLCPDAPLAEVVDGGLLEPWARVSRNNCKQTACESYATAKLNESPAEPNVPLALGLAGGAVVLIAIAGLVGYFAPHPKP